MRDFSQRISRLFKLWSLVAFAAALVMMPSEAFSIELPAYFNATGEFPNYFLPAAFRGLPPDQVPTSIIGQSTDRVEKALASVFARMTVPIAAEPGSSSHFANVRYFSTLNDHLRKIDPHCKVVPSGGVVRSSLGYLYAEMRKRLQQSPHLSTEEILEQIANEVHDIPASEIRGIGSDFDILIIPSRPELFPRLQSAALQLTNSAEAQARQVDNKSVFKRVLFTIGDAKEYDAQMKRSTSQGGSMIDFLSFDLDSGRFKEPPKFSGIVRDFILGLFDYVEPSANEAIEDGPKQTIRGLRPLIELPFMRLKREAVLKKELKALRDHLKAGGTITPKALEQFSKLTRNSRFSMGNNRLYRGEDDSVESIALEIMQLLSKDKRFPLVPEFVDQFEISAEKRKLLNKDNDPMHNYLMPVEQFIQQETDHGVLYHGTPSPDYGLAIFRDGLFLSNKRQGTAEYGRGAYSSKNRNTARGYIGANGLVLDLKVNSKLPLRILRWDDSLLVIPVFAKLAREAQATGKDLFELIARRYSIDLITNHGHVLIQNSHAVGIGENGVQPILQAVIDSIRHDPFYLRNPAEAMRQYEVLANYGNFFGISTPPAQREEFARERVRQFIQEMKSDETRRRIISTSPVPDILQLPEQIEGFDLPPKTIKSLKAELSDAHLLELAIEALEKATASEKQPYWRIRGLEQMRKFSETPGIASELRKRLAEKAALEETRLQKNLPTLLASPRLESVDLSAIIEYLEQKGIRSQAIGNAFLTRLQYRGETDQILEFLKTFKLPASTKTFEKFSEALQALENDGDHRGHKTVLNHLLNTQELHPHIPQTLQWKRLVRMNKDAEFYSKLFGPYTDQDYLDEVSEFKEAIPAKAPRYFNKESFGKSIQERYKSLSAMPAPRSPGIQALVASLADECKRIEAYPIESYRYTLANDCASYVAKIRSSWAESKAAATAACPAGFKTLKH